MDGIQRAPETGLVKTGLAKTDLANGIGIVSDRQTSKGAADEPVVSSARPAAHKAAHNAAHRAIAVITGGAARVPPSSSIHAITSKRHFVLGGGAVSAPVPRPARSP